MSSVPDVQPAARASAAGTARSGHRGWLARSRVLLRPLPLALVVGWAATRGAPATPPREPLPRAIADALASRGLVADPTDVHVIDPIPGVLASRWRHPRAVVRAHHADEPSDIYLAVSSVSPEGHLIALDHLYNITDTSAVDEQDLSARGDRVAWVLRGAGKTYSVHYADLRGEPEPKGGAWTALERWQDKLTNLQDTGSLAGIKRRHFKLDPAAAVARVSFSDSALVIEADRHTIRVPTEHVGPIDGQLYLREQKLPRARPGNLVTWAVDRVRAMPWFGNDRMQLVKAVAFDLLDWVQRVQGKVTGDTGAERVAEEMGGLGDAVPVTYRDPETGWPPPPMEPMLSPPLEGEGRWRTLDKDPFIRVNAGAPAPFITSFIRTDHERAYTQVFVLEWDPRQVSLHAMSGTVEPKSATGETGPGLVPRKPEVMDRLLAGFNGGFQATHGEFGMMAERVLYLPPKPYAATVAELADGSTAFGTWPEDDSVPDDIVSFRQNMTPLVMDGVINPYHRNWWGGVPPGWTDESRTVRSAVCLTKENFVAYLYGSSIDADHLALAMQRARCVYGIHLDMNPGHTGLEFYKAGPASEVPPLDRKLDPQWEAEGDVPLMPGWRFRGRRMLRYMGLMNFPRYIHREARDFFYLTLRHVLPVAPVASAFPGAEHGEGAWVVSGLPQHGWPYAIATSWVRPDATRPATKVHLLSLDPAMVRPARDGDGDAATVIALRPAAPGGPGLWMSGTRLAIAAKAPGANATRLASGLEPADPQAATAVAALGIDDAGMLLYAEVATGLRPGKDAAMLGALMKRLGCAHTLLLDRPLGVAIGGKTALSGEPLVPDPAAARLVRAEAPGARRIFADTPIVPAQRWYPLQSKRIRYFHKPKPKEPAAPAPAGSAAP